jgi:CheY-like chemotaxis protein
MALGRDASILVVEDNATNRVAIRALLDRFGVTADFVDTGAEAIAAVKRKPYPLVLMDLMMPGMDGYAATRQIRRLEYGTGRHTPIVAVTAVDPAVSRSECIAAGMDGFLSKPIYPDAIAEVLRKWAIGSAGERAAAASDAAEVMESFLDVTARLLEDLNEAIRSEDFSAATHLAHEIRASSLVVSAREMAQMARRLEEAIRDENWGEVIDDYRCLIAAFCRTTEELKAPVREILQHRNHHAAPPRR